MQRNAMLAITQVKVALDGKQTRLKAKIDGLLADRYYLIGTEGTVNLVLVFAKNKEDQ